MSRRTALSPRAAITALAAGHTVWGAIAYRDQVAGLVRELPGSVGDGIFDKEHSRDARAAAYWFLFVGPMLAVMGRLYEPAEAAGDRPPVPFAARGIVATRVVGFATIPRSGFPGGIALGLWLMRRAERR